MIYSYTLINTFHDVCPRQAYERYYAKSVPFVETPKLKKGKDDHKALENRLGFGHALPDHLDICEPICENLMSRGIPLTETKMGVTRQLEPCGFWDNDAYLRGASDVMLYNKPSTSVFIGDWKTGKKREDGAPLQLMILAAFAFAGTAALELAAAANIYTQTGKLGTLHTWRRSELPEIWRTVIPLIQEIELAETNKHFPERQGPLCKWCAVFSCRFNTNPEKANART